MSKNTPKQWYKNDLILEDMLKTKLMQVTIMLTRVWRAFDGCLILPDVKCRCENTPTASTYQL